MSQIFGALNLPDLANDLVNEIGEQVVFDAINEVLAAHQLDLDEAISFFVQRTTEDWTRTFKLGGGGYLDRMGRHAEAGAGKILGQWGVALPLEQWGRQLAGDRVTLAYMDLQTLDAHIDGITNQSINTTRREILKAVFNNATWEFEDESRGDLDVLPLANGDSVVYPPTSTSADEATDDHYLVSGYTAANISDANNPFPVMRQEVAEHVGGEVEDTVALINSAQTGKVEDLTDFEDQEDPRISNPNALELIGIPDNIPGRIIGRCNRVWVAEWDWIPAGYMFAEIPSWVRPLEKRVHPARTGLPQILQLVAEKNDYPLRESHYEQSFGYGVTNRLNGVVMQFKAPGTYDIPAQYKRVGLP